MKRLLALAFLAAFSVVGAGETTPGPCNELVAQQGCCAKNKGVCGCRAGKIVCCDKSFDQSCKCNKEDEPDRV